MAKKRTKPTEPASPAIRDRIKELRRVPASDLLPSPKNWRTHPQSQQDALQGILNEVGYADALLAREREDGALVLIDGHLRKDTTPGAVVPVLVLDVTEAEADKLLACLDPLAAMAGADKDRLDALLRDVHTGSEALQQMLTDLAEKSGVIPEPEQAVPHVAHNSGEEEWYTPPEYLEAARSVLGEIDLDPASSEVAQRQVRASRYFTRENDGLSKPWVGRIWMNPPYSSGVVDLFVTKLASHFRDGSVTGAIVLVNNATDTAWFRVAADVSSVICFPTGRVRFLDKEGNPNGAPLQGQAVLYLGDAPMEFCRAFSQFGFCVHRAAEGLAVERAEG